MDEIGARCSALPLAAVCPGSCRPAEVMVDAVNEAADSGTAVHFALAKLVTGTPAIESLAMATERWPSVDVDDLRFLFWSGVKMWLKISEWMPLPKVETYFHIASLSGHIDVWSLIIGGKKAVVNDWKSGRKDYSCKDQLFGYCWLIFQAFPDLEEISANASWLRTGEIESYTVSRARAEEWYAEVVGNVVNWDGTFHPGDHCEHCHRNHECPAQTALVRRDVAMFADDSQFADLQSMPGPQFVRMHRKLKGLASRIEEALKSMRPEVSRRGGDIEDGEGSHLFFRNDGGKRKVDAFKAWPILQKRFSDAELCSGLQVSVATLEKIVADKAENGKGKAKQAFCDELEAAGALTQPTVEKLVFERIK